jgi:seryl-tRNA synthetase
MLRHGNHLRSQRYPSTKQIAQLLYQKVSVVHQPITKACTKQMEMDNLTTATAFTAWSSSQNEISDLQTDSRNQLSLTNEHSMQQLESILQANMTEIQLQHGSISKKLIHVDESTEYLQREMDQIMSTLPQILHNISAQQSQLI